jgi:thymidylate kinase
MRILHRAHNLPGRLIAVCGADGTGKSTAVGLLQAFLQERYKDKSNVVLLRQPSQWWRSDVHVKSTVMLQGEAEVFDEFALGVFAFADRFNQQVKLIEPALARGDIVLVDRYSYCLVAYYMARQEPNLSHLVSLCDLLLQPNHTFVLDCAADIAIRRVVQRDGANPERSDQQISSTTKFLEAYRALALSNGLELISSLDSPEEILNKMVSHLQIPEQKRRSADN